MALSCVVVPGAMLELEGLIVTETRWAGGGGVISLALHAVKSSAAANMILVLLSQVIMVVCPEKSKNDPSFFLIKFYHLFEEDYTGLGIFDKGSGKNQTSGPPGYRRAFASVSRFLTRFRR